MGLLIRNTDFVGTYEIAQTQNSKLTYYIDRYETLYLKRILGNDLFDLFEADVTNYVPTTPIYENIYNPLVVYCSVGFGQTEAYHSEGLKQILLDLIYFEFMRDISFNASATGLVVNQNEVSTPAIPHMIYRKYNDAVNSIDAIQMYINQNSADYPDYKGENFVLNSPHF